MFSSTERSRLKMAEPATSTGLAASVDHTASLGNLAGAGGDITLSAKSWVDGHHEQEIDIGEDFADGHQGRGRVEGDTRPCTRISDGLDGAVEVHTGFHLDGDDVRARACKGLDVPIWMLDHQMHIQ